MAGRDHDVEWEVAARDELAGCENLFDRGSGRGDCVDGVVEPLFHGAREDCLFLAAEEWWSPDFFEVCLEGIARRRAEVVEKRDGLIRCGGVVDGIVIVRAGMVRRPIVHQDVELTSVSRSRCSKS